jgi:hypothetical protein
VTECSPIIYHVRPDPLRARTDRVVSSMNSPTFHNGNPQIHGGPPVDGPEKEAVLRELESILSSPFFRTSNRSKQFLAYVVQHTLEGNHEPLKERTIGAKLFQRPVGYATGDDPVVRVQAGEVRRRLEQYHHAALNDSRVRIELPVGSYAPEFRWVPTAPHQEEPVRAEATPKEPPQEETTPAAMTSVAEAKQLAKSRSLLMWAVPILCLALILVLLASILHRSSAQGSALNQFWSPVLTTSEPVLICLAKPTVYLPSAELLQRYSKSPGSFKTELQRLTQPSPLQPQDKLVWGDMVEYADYGVAAGDVYAAVRLSALLGRMGKESQVRIGSHYSFADLRNSPAIVVGAFNNRWTMQMTSNLHFAFVEENGEPMIREQGPSGRAWHAKFGPHGEVTEDFGIVTRLLNSKTGQFVVSTAGTLATGTQAAGEFVSSSEYLEEALRTAPPDWAKKNLQFVVQATVTDSVPGPPQAVAIYTW